MAEKKEKPLISVVMNTLNNADKIARSLKSVQKLADEIVVVDMYSDDDSRKIAKKYGAKVYFHKKTGGYVEPARNFAISKATGKWVLILDTDEVVPRSLAERLKQIALDPEKKDLDCVLIPRKNLIFGKWMENARWWPDYLPRFFRRGKVEWPKQIHQQPKLNDKNIFTLPDVEKMALIHHNYENLDQFLDRNRIYSRVRAMELIKEKNYKLGYKDLLIEPLNEFLSRFFSGEAYRDGLHGLALSLLQAWTVLLTYLKVWEESNYEEKPLEPRLVKEVLEDAVYRMEFWRDDFILKNTSFKFTPLLEWLLKIRAKLLRL